MEPPKTAIAKSTMADLGNNGQRAPAFGKPATLTAIVPCDAAVPQIPGLAARGRHKQRKPAAIRAFLAALFWQGESSNLGHLSA
jgi:hypothetical protein